MFRFKEFVVEDSDCAMKVCTDSCILGAWVHSNESKKILDIGAGSGLISLMLAQRFERANIIAIEIDEKASKQCISNFDNSPWKESLDVINQDFISYLSDEKFDLIVSNPPFYENNLKSDNSQKNIAHHAQSLSFKQLIEGVVKNIAANGKFFVLLPAQTFEQFMAIVHSNSTLQTFEILEISNFIAEIPFRYIVQFQCIDEKVESNTKSLAIKVSRQNNVYTPEFAQLLKDYYLIF